MNNVNNRLIVMTALIFLGAFSRLFLIRQILPQLQLSLFMQVRIYEKINSSLRSAGLTLRSIFTNFLNKIYTEQLVHIPGEIDKNTVCLS